MSDRMVAVSLAAIEAAVTLERERVAAKIAEVEAGASVIQAARRWASETAATKQDHSAANALRAAVAALDLLTIPADHPDVPNLVEAALNEENPTDG